MWPWDSCSRCLCIHGRMYARVWNTYTTELEAIIYNIFGNRIWFLLALGLWLPVYKALIFKTRVVIRFSIWYSENVEINRIWIPLSSDRGILLIPILIYLDPLTPYSETIWSKVTGSSPLPFVNLGLRYACRGQYFIISSRSNAGSECFVCNAFSRQTKRACFNGCKSTTMVMVWSLLGRETAYSVL